MECPVCHFDLRWESDQQDGQYLYTIYSCPDCECDVVVTVIVDPADATED